MPLTASGPPGRPNRKARDFAPDIARLRAEGYTLDQIRQALAVAGVQVSRSTVWRETARKAGPLALASATIAAGQSPPSPAPAPFPAHPAPIPAAPAAPAPTPRPLQHLSGREVAEEWFKGRTTNPLLTPRTRP